MEKKRRAVALGLSGASTVAVWNKPFISSAVLPAHAETSCTTYALCDTGSGGGLVFMIENDEAEGCHGLEAAPAPNQSDGVQWGCSGTDIMGTSTGIELAVSMNGAVGSTNTDLILADCPFPANTSAASVARAYVGSNGDTDWFLPSRDELDRMYSVLHLNGKGGFENDFYWSSSQFSTNFARFQGFFDGIQGSGSKNSTLRVRAVRAF